jgi:Ca2+:H+ antiporter
LPVEGASNEEAHAAPPTVRVTSISAALLLACLGAVVLLAKALAPAVETTVASVGAPEALVGIIIAAVVIAAIALAASVHAQSVYPSRPAAEWT